MSGTYFGPALRPTTLLSRPAVKPHSVSVTVAERTIPERILRAVVSDDFKQIQKNPNSTITRELIFYLNDGNIGLATPSTVSFSAESRPELMAKHDVEIVRYSYVASLINGEPSLKIEETIHSNGATRTDHQIVEMPAFGKVENVQRFISNILNAYDGIAREQLGLLSQHYTPVTAEQITRTNPSSDFVLRESEPPSRRAASPSLWGSFANWAKQLIGRKEPSFTRPALEKARTHTADWLAQAGSLFLAGKLYEFRMPEDTLETKIGTNVSQSSHNIKILPRDETKRGADTSKIAGHHATIKREIKSDGTWQYTLIPIARSVNVAESKERMDKTEEVLRNSVYPISKGQVIFLTDEIYFVFKPVENSSDVAVRRS